MEQVLTGKCHTKECKRGHPMVCRNMEKEETCSNLKGCHYLHPANYYRQDGGFQNNKNGNNNGMNYVNNYNNNNNSNDNNNNNSNNNNNNKMNGYYNGYRGYQ